MNGDIGGCGPGASRNGGPVARLQANSRLEPEDVDVRRKAWLFVGSDDHATAAGHLFSLIASARLHGLDPEAYLRDLFRVLAHWPRDRYLKLAPRAPITLMFQ